MCGSACSTPIERLSTHYGVATRQILLKPSPVLSPGLVSFAQKYSGLPLIAYCFLPSSRVTIEYGAAAVAPSAAKSGGQDSAYPWGNDSATCQRAIMDDPASGSGCGKGSTLPVCSKPAGNSVQGLCDMAGNVREWTSSEYVPPATESTPGFDSYGDATVKMVVRGGSWFNGPKFVRASSRGGVLPTERSVYTGFRVARDAP